jgi:hypothetical protein
VGIRKSISIAVVGLVSGVLSMAANAAAATFTSIDFSNATSTDALGINSARDIVGRYDSADGKTHGYLRNRRGRFITIDFRDANTNFTVAAGINSHRVIVGQYRLSTDPQGARHGFVQSRRGTFTTIDFPNAAFTNALGINDRGEIVGRYCTVLPCLPQNQHGFLRSRRGHFSTIDFPGAAGTIAGTNAWGINDGGKIVGGYQGSNGKSHVYLRHHNQFTTIDFPTAVDPNAVDTAPFGSKGGINSRGNIVSYYCNLEPCVVNNNMLKLDNDSEHGFLLSHEGAFTRIDVPNSHGTLAFGINDRRDIVGTYHDVASGKQLGFLLKQ